MAGSQQGSEGLWTFLTYGLTVLGAALGIFHATSGTGNANPLIWLVIGALAGRGFAWGLSRLFGRGG